MAEVDRESDTVAVVAGEDHHVFAARMPLRGKPAEDGEHFFGEENRAAPAVRDAHGGKGRVQMADAVFEPAETPGGFASANIVPLWSKPLRGKPEQIVRAVFDRRQAAQGLAQDGISAGTRFATAPGDCSLATRQNPIMATTAIPAGTAAA